MHSKTFLTALIVLIMVASGCVSRSTYKEEVERNKQQAEETKWQKRRADNLEETVSRLDSQIENLKGNKYLDDQIIGRLNNTIDDLNNRVSNLELSKNTMKGDKNTTIQGLQKTIKKLRGENKDLKNSLDDLQSENTKLSRWNNEWNNKNSDMNDEIERLEQTNDNLNSKLSDIRTQFASYRSWEKSIVVDEKLYFESASAELTEYHESQLNKAISQIQNHPKKLILVSGHADTVPIAKAPFSSNWDLSAKRASSVVEYLTSNSSLDSARFSIKGRGEFEREFTEDRRNMDQVLDRRVEISLVPRR